MSNYKKLFSGIIVFIAALIIINAIYKNDLFTETPTNNKTVKLESFNYQLQQAMKKQQKLKEEHLKNKKDVYIQSLKDEYGEEVFEQKLAVCELFTNLYKNNRTKENEIKYIKACDPAYH